MNLSLTKKEKKKVVLAEESQSAHRCHYQIIDLLIERSAI